MDAYTARTARAALYAAEVTMRHDPTFDSWHRRSERVKTTATCASFRTDTLVNRLAALKVLALRPGTTPEVLATAKHDARLAFCRVLAATDELVAAVASEGKEENEPVKGQE